MLRSVVWVFVFGGIALAGLVMLIAYAVWLAHKASDVMSELGVLADRGGPAGGAARTDPGARAEPGRAAQAQPPHGG
jgi:hypothetical protein